MKRPVTCSVKIPGRRSRLLFCFFELGDFVDLAGFVVSGPLAGLLSFFEMTGAHFSSVFSEPFPVARGDIAGQLAFGPNRSVFVVMDVWFGLCFFGHGA